LQKKRLNQGAYSAGKGNNFVIHDMIVSVKSHTNHQFFGYWGLVYDITKHCIKAVIFFGQEILQETIYCKFYWSIL